MVLLIINPQRMKLEIIAGGMLCKAKMGISSDGALDN